MISSGLRGVFRYLVEHNHVSAVVTTAGGIEEDFIKCLGDTYLSNFSAPGSELRKKGMNRIGNLVVPNANYCAFEDWVVPILDKMLEEQEASKGTEEEINWTPSKVIHRLGKEINDERSVYYWAYKNNIPVFCPALTDGSLGDMLYFHTFKSSPLQLKIDLVEDIRKINTMSVRAKRAGMIILGGGVVKHHIANACLMRNGAESAVYINTGQEFDGSDAGARPDEAVSWGKIKMDAESVKVRQATNPQTLHVVSDRLLFLGICGGYDLFPINSCEHVCEKYQRSQLNTVNRKSIQVMKWMHTFFRPSSMWMPNRQTGFRLKRLFRTLPAEGFHTWVSLNPCLSASEADSPMVGAWQSLLDHPSLVIAICLTVEFSMAVRLIFEFSVAVCLIVEFSISISISFHGLIALAPGTALGLTVQALFITSLAIPCLIPLTPRAETHLVSQSPLLLPLKLNLLLFHFLPNPDQVEWFLPHSLDRLLAFVQGWPVRGRASLPGEQPVDHIPVIVCSVRPLDSLRSLVP